MVVEYLAFGKPIASESKKATAKQTFNVVDTTGGKVYNDS